jgi:hypothetical protein
MVIYFLSGFINQIYFFYPTIKTSFSGCCCEELSKKDAEIVIPIYYNSRGLPPSFIYVVPAARQDPGRTETSPLAGRHQQGYIFLEIHLFVQ